MFVPAGTELSSVGVTLVELLQHLLTLGVRVRVAEGEEGGGSSRLREPVSERKHKLVVCDLENRRKTKTFIDACCASTFFTFFTSVVGLSRILSQRFFPGNVRTRGAMPWL